MARMIGRDPSTVSRWKRPKSEGGCDGKIPRLACEKILEVAKTNRIDIRLSDLFNGRRVGKN